MLKKKETITQNHINKVLLKYYTCFFDTYRYESQIMSNTLVSYDIMTFLECKYFTGCSTSMPPAAWRSTIIALKVPKPANFDLVFFTSLNSIWVGDLEVGNKMFFFFYLSLVLA
jgi:hypothetical protein